MARFFRGSLSNMRKGSYDGIFGSTSDTDISEAVDALGGGSSGRRELAERMSGTTNRSSREYKNARDYISRHLRGSRRSVKSPEYRKVIAGANREGKKNRVIESGSLNVTITGHFKVSSRVYRGAIKAKALTGDALRNYVNAVERGDMQTALNIVSRNYGMPDIAQVNRITSVEYS